MGSPNGSSRGVCQFWDNLGRTAAKPARRYVLFEGNTVRTRNIVSYNNVSLYFNSYTNIIDIKNNHIEGRVVYKANATGFGKNTGYIHNRFSGLNFTVSNFGTTLGGSTWAAATDSDDSTATGWFNTTTIGSGTIGDFTFNMNIPRNVQLHLKVGMNSTKSSTTCLWQFSDDGTHFYNMSGATVCTATSTTETVMGGQVEGSLGHQYIRLHVAAVAAETGTIRIYEVRADDLDS